MKIRKGSMVTVRRERVGMEEASGEGVLRSHEEEVSLRVPFTQEVDLLQPLVLEDGHAYILTMARDGEFSAKPAIR